MGQDGSGSGQASDEWTGPLDMLDVARLLATAEDRHAVFACLLQRLIERFQADRAFAIFTSEGGGLDLKMIHNVRRDGARDWDSIISRTIVEDVAERRVPVLIQNALTHPVLKKHTSVLRRGIRSVMCVPMIAGGELLGVVYADNLSEAGKFTEADLEMLTLVVAHASAALYGAQRLVELSEECDKTLPSADLKFLSQTAAGMAHDFKNILVAIQMRLELLQRDDAEGKLAYNISQARQAVEAGREIIRQTAGLAALHPEAEMTEVDLCDVIRQVVQHLDYRLEGTHPAYELRLALPERMMVRGNLTQLKEVVINLFSNALDAMPGGGELEVSLTKEADCCDLSVRDSGHGMAPEVLEKVFEPFFSTKGAMGMGLGLSVAKAVVSRHGGTITAESTPSHGSVFHVCLPRLKKHDRD